MAKPVVFNPQPMVLCLACRPPHRYGNLAVAPLHHCQILGPMGKPRLCPGWAPSFITQGWAGAALGPNPACGGWEGVVLGPQDPGRR